MTERRKKNTVTVFAPATVGNIACGFDCMGLAINNPGDVVTLKKNAEKKLIIREITGDNGRLSYSIKKNTVSVAIAAYLKATGIQQGFDIVLHKRMPLGSGLGSSAASAVAGVYAASLLTGNKLSREELIPFAMEGERIACGSAHADNVAPSMLGGIILIRSNHPLEVIALPAPSKLYIVVIHPHAEVLTKDARAVLKKEIPLGTAIQQWSNTAALVAGLYKEDYELIGKATVDHVAEPYRASLIPAFHQVKKAAFSNGALACSISGSGSSMFAFCKGLKDAKRTGAAMQASFRKAKIQSELYISTINNEGAKVIA
ncbi:MAG: homoserine kinase [Bacteroidota bacterium]